MTDLEWDEKPGRPPTDWLDELWRAYLAYEKGVRNFLWRRAA